MKNKANIIFFGAPGAGKGTQAKKVSSELKIPHLDTGNLIREAITGGTGLGKKAKEYVEGGNLVPDDLVIGLIREKLLELKGNDFKGFILDGFPRTIPQAEALGNMMKELNLQITKVLNVQVPENILIERLSARRLCSNKSCGAIYNMLTKKTKHEGKCDLCGSDLYQRKDDTTEAAQQRLNEYHNKTAPIENYYRKQTVLADVDGTKDPQAVYNKILEIISPN
jgi:adenylate kinase